MPAVGFSYLIQMFTLTERWTLMRAQAMAMDIHQVPVQAQAMALLVRTPGRVFVLQYLFNQETTMHQKAFTSTFICNDQTCEIIILQEEPKIENIVNHITLESYMRKHGFSYAEYTDRLNQGFLVGFGFSERLGLVLVRLSGTEKPDPESDPKSKRFIIIT